MRTKLIELTMKKPFPGRAIKRANDIRIALNVNRRGWKGITLNFVSGVFKSHPLTKDQVDSFLDPQGDVTPFLVD